MNDLQIQNPYGKSEVVVPATRGVIDVESSRSIAEVQAMVLMAKRFPRDPVAAMDRILTECQRQGLAEVAIYSYSRAGTEISGPSIRLSEVLARNWTNLDVGVKELSQSGGKSEMMSYCVDLEANYRQAKIFTVPHTRHTKKGSYDLSDPRDIYEALANQAARRLRAVILAVIPGDIVEAAVQQCEATLKAKADTSPEAVKKMVDAFGAYGVTKEQIEKRIQRRIDSITPAQIISLRKVYNSLKDGMGTVRDWFETEVVDEPATKGAAALKEKLKKKPAEPVEKQTVKPPAGCPYKEDGEANIKNCITESCYTNGSCTAWGQREPGSDG